MRTVEWVDGALDVVDQTALPELRRVRLSTVDDVVSAIDRLVVRGAPLLGVVGALGVALAARELPPAAVPAAAERIAAARPTAVNLRWGVDIALAALDRGPVGGVIGGSGVGLSGGPLVAAGGESLGGPVGVLSADPDGVPDERAEAVLAAALAVLDDDVRRCRAVAERGADLLTELCGERPLALHTHCNAGAMACVDWGTALGVVRALHGRGLVRLVVVDETRPLLQGARITTVELAGLGVEHRVIVDSAGPSVIARGLVDAVIVGADRIAANGDVANKVGTYPLALAAARAGIPFVVAAPESTVDVATPSGASITIEDRPGAEVLGSSPPGTQAWNPAFDVTPADLVTAIVTDERVLRP